MTKKTDGTFAVTLSLDKRWLNDPERVFPVLVDPSFSIPQPTIDGTFNATVGSSLPNMTDTYLKAGKDPARGRSTGRH